MNEAQHPKRKTEAESETVIAKPTRLWAIIADRALRFEIFGRAAQLAYYQLFSLFPLLIMIGIVLSRLPMENLWEDLLGYMRGVMPPHTFNLIRTTLEQAAGHRPEELFSVSLLALIWAASTGMEALIGSLNVAYGVSEARSWWRERVLAILLTFGLSTFILVSLTVIVFGSSIISLIADTYGYGDTFKVIWHVAQWPIAAACVLFGLDLVYYFAPNISQPWRWITPGGVLALLCWLIISLGIKLYVTRITDYNVTYGVLGSFMILMLWLYLTSATVLIGGVINGSLMKDEEPENTGKSLIKE